MSVGERDQHTGHMTTGHEWNGIKELNTPVPFIVWFFLGAAVLTAILCWILLPAWPLGRTYTKGLLGIDQQSRVEAELKKAVAARSVWTRKISALDHDRILADPKLMKDVRETGAALFGDNCAVCHGARAQGGVGYPSLTDAAWLWGGAPAQIEKTIRFGINSGHDEGRTSQMLAFGKTGVLDHKAILAVIDYIRSLSADAAKQGDRPGDVSAGRKIFAANCVACHGKDGKGRVDLGAPDLTDNHWIYGGDRQSIYDSINLGRQGQMPSWDKRLTSDDRKILTLYLLDLGSRRPSQAKP